jgi:hypothetical protein
MNCLGNMGYAGRGRRMGPHWGHSVGVPLRMSLLAGVAVFLFATALFSGFPPYLFFFVWMVPFFLVPMLGLIARGTAGLLAAWPRRVPEGDKERELLEALKRHGEITAARAALETTLSVSEADRMLSELAKKGHIEVRAHEGRLGYALWEHDRRELPG